MPDEVPLKEASALLLEEARRMLVRQESDLDGLRLRTAGMISVAALVAGLFGTRLAGAHQSGRVVIAATVALALFAGTVAVALVILAPKKDWVFGENLDALATLLRAGDLTPVDVTANLAEHYEGYRRENQPRLDCLYRAFLVVCLLIGAQVIAWAVAVV